jgi:hypothetical protein
VYKRQPYNRAVFDDQLREWLLANQAAVIPVAPKFTVYGLFRDSAARPGLE